MPGIFAGQESRPDKKHNIGTDSGQFPAGFDATIILYAIRNKYSAYHPMKERESHMAGKDIALIGLAVMGQNLARNMARNGYEVLVYNRSEEKTREFMAGPGQEERLSAAYSLAELSAGLEKPRKVFLMVKAGAAVDAVIESLLPHLEPGDLIMDGGNSHYADTTRRMKELNAKGFKYLGIGVSGGEEGALWGPAIMPGGDKEAYGPMEPVLRAIAAKADDGEPCVAFMGSGGAGHFVKMVHNGIEYGDMQLIAEAYHIMKSGLGLSAEELHDVFAKWNQGELSSYLIEISADIFKKIDEKTGEPLVEKVLDQAGQKGTGRWTAQIAMDLGAPTHTINAAVESRIISAYKEERMAAEGVLKGPRPDMDQDKAAMIEAVGHALYAAKICSYAQGFTMLRAADAEHGFGLDYPSIAKIWRAGCIIRARFLDDVSRAFGENPGLANLMLAPFFAEAMNSRQASLRKVVAAAAGAGIPLPAMGASLAYYDSYRSGRLPANLLQAQRDYFGAHTYRRVDEDGVFHSQWN